MVAFSGVLVARSYFHAGIFWQYNVRFWHHSAAFWYVGGAFWYGGNSTIIMKVMYLCIGIAIGMLFTVGATNGQCLTGV